MKGLRFARLFLCCFAVVCVAQQSADLDKLLQEGAAFNRQSDYTRAIPVLRQAINLAPQNPTANYLLGVALLQSGHPADAVAPLQIAAQATSGDYAAAGYLGDAEMELKEFSLAAEAFLSAVSRSPESEQTLIWWTDYSLERYRVLELSLRTTARGRAAMLLGAAESVNIELKQKKALLEQAAELDPGFPEILGELGIAQALLGEQAEAVASLKVARQNAPNAISIVKLEALVAAARGNWDEANSKLLDLDRRSQAEFKGMVAEWPKNLLPGVNRDDPLWQCLRNSRSDCAAIRVQPDADQTAPSPQLYAEGRWERLIAAHAPPADDAASWFWRGMALARTGDCAHAIPALERGLRPARKWTLLNWPVAISVKRFRAPIDCMRWEERRPFISSVATSCCPSGLTRQKPSTNISRHCVCGRTIRSCWRSSRKRTLARERWKRRGKLRNKPWHSILIARSCCDC